MIVLSVAVAGCARNDRVIGSVPLSYEDRHPIQVGQYPVVLDVDSELNAAGLQPSDRTAVYGFVRQYRNEGESALNIHTPAGTGSERGSQVIAQEIRQIAAQEGIPGNFIVVQPYHAADRAFAPVRLSFSRLRATRPECGFFPSDISGTGQNRDYENFGCAHQNNLAVMMEDPRDLLGPRGSSPRDSQRRTDMFDKWRTAQDPATQYDTESEASSSQVGGE